MKSLLRRGRALAALTCTLVFAASLAAVPASAATARDAVNSVVFVVEQYTGQDKNGNPEAQSAWGTGFAIGKVGKPVQFIVTNYHVIAGAYTDKSTGSVQVVFSAAANRYVSAEVYWENEQKDLAVLRLPEPTTERKAMVLVPEKYVDFNDTFHALGYPVDSFVGNDFLKFDTSDINDTRGGISKTARIDQTDMYQLDLTIDHGTSGGPLVDSKGRVGGSNAMKISATDGNGNAITSASYAIQIDELIRNIDPTIIPLTIYPSLTTVDIIYIVVGSLAGIAVIVLIVLIILRSRKKKSPAAIPAVDAAPVYEEPAAPQPSVTAQVLGVTGYFQGRSFPLQGQLKFGRDNNSCNVVFPIDQPGISGSHCVLSAEPDGVYLTDLGSSYGTFLGNGTKLAPGQRARLNNGDTFCLAGEVNTFEVRIG